jgi:hypothetical protein
VPVVEAVYVVVAVVSGQFREVAVFFIACVPVGGAVYVEVPVLSGQFGEVAVVFFASVPVGGAVYVEVPVVSGQFGGCKCSFSPVDDPGSCCPILCRCVDGFPTITSYIHYIL